MLIEKKLIQAMKHGKESCVMEDSSKENVGAYRCNKNSPNTSIIRYAKGLNVRKFYYFDVGNKSLAFVFKKMPSLKVGLF